MGGFTSGALRQQITPDAIRSFLASDNPLARMANTFIGGSNFGSQFDNWLNQWGQQRQGQGQTAFQPQPTRQPTQQAGGGSAYPGFEMPTYTWHRSLPQFDFAGSPYQPQQSQAQPYGGMLNLPGWQLQQLAGGGADTGWRPSLPQQTGTAQPSQASYQYFAYPDASPPGQAAGNQATASGINTTAEAIAQGLSLANAGFGLVAGIPGITGIGLGINALGLNDLNIPGLQVNNELSTNNVAQDIAAINAAINAHYSENLATPTNQTGVDATGIGVGVGGQGQGISGSNLSGFADSVDAGTTSGSANNAPSDMSESDAGPAAWRKGGYIPGDGDGRLEARRITAHEGEYVIRPEAVKAIGRKRLAQLNRKRKS